MTDSRRKSVRLPSDEQREHLMVRAAKLYYNLDATQNHIAAELGLTRWQVGRLLAEAREVGVVQIEITPRALRKAELEVELQRAYALRDAIVVPTGDIEDTAQQMERVAQAAAAYISSIHPRPDLLAVSWGRTMSAIVRFLPHNWNPGVHVVLVNGATTLRSTTTRNSAVAEEFAQTAGGVATLLPVPAIVGNPSTRDALQKDPVIAPVLTLAEEANVICFGMGGLSHHSVLLNSGYLTTEDIDRLRELGAVGDILGRFVDSKGRVVDTQIDDRTVGLGLNALPKKERAIGVVSGEEKRAIALAALTAGYISVLVTDEETARHVLEKQNDG